MTIRTTYVCDGCETVIPDIKMPYAIFMTRTQRSHNGYTDETYLHFCDWHCLERFAKRKGSQTDVVDYGGTMATTKTREEDHQADHETFNFEPLSKTPTDAKETESEGRQTMEVSFPTAEDRRVNRDDLP